MNTDKIKSLLRRAIHSEFKVPMNEICINIEGKIADVKAGNQEFSVWLDCRNNLASGAAVSFSADGQDAIKASGAKYMLLHSPRAVTAYFVYFEHPVWNSYRTMRTKDEMGDDILTYCLKKPTIQPRV